MQEQNESRKVQETKQRTKNAFLELCGEKKIDKISVKELTARAGINRSTFYAHYQDIYDLKEQVLTDFRATMQKKVLPLVMDIAYGRNMTEASYIIIKMYEENRALYRAFLVKNRDDRIVDGFKTVSMEILRKRFSGMGVAPPDDLEYIMEYIIAGQFALLGMWASTEKPISAENLVRLVRDLNYFGPVHCLFAGNTPVPDDSSANSTSPM